MEPKKIGTGFGVMILHNNKVLLGQRHVDPAKADSELQGEGTWTMPGGKLHYGESFEEGAKRVLGIAGGVGAAPIFPQLRELSDSGVSVDLVLGARNKDYIILDEDFAKITENRYICTDDGSMGTKGFITDKFTTATCISFFSSSRAASNASYIIGPVTNIQTFFAWGSGLANTTTGDFVSIFLYSSENITGDFSLANLIYTGPSMS